MKKRFSEEQIIGFLHEADSGLAIKDLCRRHGFSEASYYQWRNKFGGSAMVNWAHKHGVKLFLIEPSKPNQNAYIESFNGRFRDECLNEHWFINLPQAKIIIDAWRRQYNEERPKKALGGLTQKAYAGLLAQNENRLSTEDSKSNCYS